MWLQSFFEASFENLKTHVSFVHVGKKPFQCEFCDYRISRKGDLNKHVSLFQTKENRYCCHDWTAKFCVLWNVNCSDVRGGKLSDLKQEFGQTIKDREDEVREEAKTVKM